MRVETLDLVREFGPTRAVDGITFSFSSGEVFGFVGPNGAGKTTTMRILATLDEPTSGDARIDGVSIVEEPEAARRLLGYVPDSLPAHRDVSVHDYLDFFARAYGLAGAARRRVVDGVEEFTNLTGLREKMIEALSKGMKQRVCLARALLHDPPALVLDEPAAGLDPRARVELRELLRVLAGQGKAVLISSHILSELAEICTGAVILEHGRILRAGSMEEILGSVTSRRTVVLRPRGRKEELARALLEMPGVSAARLLSTEVEVDLDGPDEVACELLARVVGAGFDLYEFRQQRGRLEEVFMSVTKGEVG